MATPVPTGHAAPSKVDNLPRVSALWTVVVLLFVAIAIARIVATYWVFNQTMDEPHQVASGLEWWEYGTYTFDAETGPLPRIAIALPAYLKGAHLGDTGSAQLEGNRFFFGSGDYLTNLALSRMAALPFFVLATVVVALWARKLSGNVGAAAAVFLFTTLPPVLAHSGLATTDITATATFVLAFFLLVAWLENPSWKLGLALGFSFALVAATKITGSAYLVAGGTATAAVAGAMRRASKDPAPRVNGRAWSLVLAGLVAILVTWAFYRFSLQRLTGYPSPEMKLASAIYSVGRRVPLPAPDFWRGLAMISVDNAAGRHSYLLGATRAGGFPEFFVVALLVKTPLPFLILALVGSLVTIYLDLRQRTWQRLAPLLGAAAIMAVSLFSHVNIGLRHILPVYPLLSIVAGVGVARLWEEARQHASPGGAPHTTRNTRALITIALAALLGWQAWEGIAAHPDYLAYFNQFAGGHGERILVDSDLDWGQDVLRLATELRARHIDDIWFAYFGSANPKQLGVPGAKYMPPFAQETGWIAISEYRLKLGDIPPETWHGYDWLKPYTPVTRVGKSIVLYYIPPK